MLATKSSTTVVNQRGNLSSRKKLLFLSVVVVGTLIALEAISAMLLIRRESTLTESFAALRKDQQDLATSGRDQDSARETIHPYVGWTFNPEVDPGVELNGRLIPVNTHGLVDSQDSIHKKSENTVIIAITGGSFAQHFGIDASDTIVAQLQNNKNFSGREIIIVRLAMAGYKQPQQLLWLSYLYSLGAEFDYVINIDGFNEGVLPVTDHFKQQIHFSYPHHWNARLAETIDPAESETVLTALELRTARKRAAANILKSPLRWSSIRNLIWRLRDTSLKNELHDLELEFFHNRQEFGDGFAVEGPPNPEYESGAFDDALLDLWKHSSLQMHNLCSTNDTVYVHILQPNQYLPDSKPLTDWEKEFAYAPGHDFEKQVQKIYPRMQQQSDWFARHGVRFHDMTSVFSERTDSIYADWCCHINVSGNQLLAEQIANFIIAVPPQETRDR